MIRRTTGDSGFTLLEMLIVLAIIAVAAGATVLSLAPRRDEATEAEARRLATTIQAAVDRSIATGARPTLAIDDAGYSVDDGPRHGLPAGTGLRGPAVPRLSLAFNDGQAFDLVVAHGRDRWVISFDGLRAVAAAAKDAA